MNELNSTEALEWPLVLEELAKRASSELGKELCFNLPVAPSFQEAVKIQNQTSEALLLIDREGSIPLGGFRNIRRSLDDLYRGSILQGTTFLDIASTLRSVRN